MKKWVKGFMITGIVMLCAGTGMTAAAAVMSHGRIGSEDSLGKTRQFYNEHLKDILPAHWGDELDSVVVKVEDGLTFGDDGWSDWWEDRDFSDTDGTLQNLEQRIEKNIEIPSRDEMRLAASYDNVSALDLQVEGGAVKVVENRDLNRQINVYIETKSGWNVTSERDDDSSGEISINYRYHGDWKRPSHPTGIVEVPAGFHFDEAKLKAKGAVITANELMAGKLSLEAEGGALFAGNLTADSLDAEVKAGALAASGKVSSKVETEVKAGAAALTLDGRVEDYSYETDSLSGTVSVDGHFPTSLHQYHGAKRMELNCSAGALKINFKTP